MTTFRSALLTKLLSRMTNMVRPGFGIGVLIMAGAALPARADGIVYDNDFGGIVSGDHYQVGAFQINSGRSITDSFSLSSNTSVSGFNLALWMFSGDSLTSLNWYITTSNFGGTTLGSGSAASPTNQTFLETNAFGVGFDIYEETFNISPGLALNAGTTYWLQLDTAVTAESSTPFWDISDGPSTAYSSYLGLLPAGFSCCTGSQSFEILTPEPGTLALLGGGLIALAGLRRLVCGA